MAKVDFTDNSKEFIDELKSKAQAALEPCGLMAEGYAKMNLQKPKAHSDGTSRPNVQSATLVNSISHAVDGESAYIGTNVEYAPYVEMGTSKSRPYPYLQPAVQDHESEYQAIFIQHLQG